MIELRLRIGTAEELNKCVGDIVYASRRQHHLWKDNDHRTVAISYEYGDRFWVEFPGSIVFGHSPGECEVWAYANGSLPYSVIRDVFERSVLPLMLHLHGIESLHASAIETKKGIVAFCGQSHAGKSTIAHGLTQLGYHVWADDAVAFHAGPTAPTVVSLPFETHLRQKSLSYFSGNESCRGGMLERRAANALSQPMLAVFLLAMDRGEQNGESKITVEELTGSEALISLLEHAYSLDISEQKHKGSMFQKYADVVHQTSIFRLNYPAGFAHLPTVLERIDSTINKISRGSDCG